MMEILLNILFIMLIILSMMIISYTMVLMIIMFGKIINLVLKI